MGYNFKHQGQLTRQVEHSSALSTSSAQEDLPGGMVQTTQSNYSMESLGFSISGASPVVGVKKMWISRPVLRQFCPFFFDLYQIFMEVQY